MTDVELARAFERGEIRNEDFHHVSHLRVAWVYLSESQSTEEAAERLSVTLKRFAASAGKPEKYHETVTRFWTELLAKLRDSTGSVQFDQLVVRNPQLLEKNFSLQYYSRDLLFSDLARTTWVEPDLKPLPTNAIAVCSSSSARHPSNRAVYRRSE